MKHSTGHHDLMDTRSCLFELFENLLALGRPLADMLAETLPAVGGSGWWKNCVAGKMKDDDLRIVLDGGKTALSELDISILLKVLIRNWNELAALDGRRFSARKKDLVRAVRDIRNDTMHLTGDRAARIDFGSAFDTISRFAAFLGADMANSVERLYEARSGEEDVIRKEELYALINSRILEPAMTSTLLDSDIKESVEDTRKRLQAKSTPKEIYDFFYDALSARRGRQIYNALKDADLLSFEDIVNDFFNLYWRKT